MRDDHTHPFLGEYWNSTVSTHQGEAVQESKFVLCCALPAGDVRASVAQNRHRTRSRGSRDCRARTRISE